jgi:hypothetical protein
VDSHLSLKCAQQRLLEMFNVLHKTSKGMRDINYQDTQQFEQATMLKLPIQPLLVLCGVMPRFYFFDYQHYKNYFTIK